jgi:uncharacterized protein YbbC (DUF1343 family)
MLYCNVLLGIDRLVKENFNPLRGMKLGLLTNISCCDRELHTTISRFEESRKVDLRAIFAPEHGFFTALQDQVKASDSQYRGRQRIHSLYGPRREPGLKTLKSLDTIVIDLPDIGTRYYTFLWSAMLMIAAAAKIGKKILILDRPNPLGGTTVQGPMIDPGFESFVGLYSVPVRHGMTLAELCNMLNHEYNLQADLKIIRMKGWQRAKYGDELQLKWTFPSPNMPCFSTSLVYPGMCLLEGTNVSEGRGTTRPFEMFGAPWVDSDQLMRNLEKYRIPGVAFRPTFFIPTFNKYRNQLCKGVHMYVTDRKRFDPVLAGLQVIKTIHDLYQDDFHWRQPPYEFEREKMPFDILIGNAWVRKELENNTSINTLVKKWQADLIRFKRLRNKYLLYN